MQTETQKEQTLAALDSMRLLADSPTLLHVLRLAARMEAKLAKNRHKGDRDGWLKDHPQALWERSIDELGELCEAIGEDDPNKVWDEAADVANFAMMVADSFEANNSANAEVSDGGPLTHESPAAQSRRSLH